ncbi:MAG: hypothetical protein LIO85_03655 [Rikenellaceae bacterium]|nr:hypothetical protein [Rikenellaceae bacterium]
MKKISIALGAVCLLASCGGEKQTPIDRYALVTRNNPHVTGIDPLASLSVGNGRFAFTVDATGLQTFPEYYSPGVPLGTQSEWGWHSFPNPEGYRHEEVLGDVELFGRHGLYARQFNEPARKKGASDWFRVNPHRLHLGVVGLEITGPDGTKASPEDITGIDQRLDLWDGIIHSTFTAAGTGYTVSTVCDPDEDLIASRIVTDGAMPGGVNFRFPYPTGQHSDDACDWTSPSKHTTRIISQDDSGAILERRLDGTVYYVAIRWEQPAVLEERQAHYFVLSPIGGNELAFTCGFYDELPAGAGRSYNETTDAAAAHRQAYWNEGGVVDFSLCTDERAAELERRVVLSQYLTSIQCAGSSPPQESGLTYNTWFGRPHLEMHWWHGVHFALWGRPQLLENSIGWYGDVAFDHAAEIARRQNFDGVRWMKMTDPWAGEAPSNVGSFLIWQQPHIIYFAELMYRADPSPETIEKYRDVVFATADFMYSFAVYDAMEGRFVLEGMIPAQETLRAATTINPPFELSYWHFAMETAQKWRERAGLPKNLEWEELIDKLSPLAYNDDGLYLASEDATDTYIDIRFTSDHMAVLGALGILPKSKLVREDYMENTLEWVWDNWNWGKTWGWDFPMTAMNAARLGRQDLAVGSLLMDKRTNTYLVSGHNYQDTRLRIYMPGNGGLLTAVAMMAAGWDGAPDIPNPGFPQDGSWIVRWEGLERMP